MMPFSEILVFGLLAYFLYRFLFEFLLPIFRTTRKMHRHFQNFRENMNGGPNGHAEPDGHQSNPSGSHTNASPNDNRSGKPHHPSYDSIGEYIDFEEVKK